MICTLAQLRSKRADILRLAEKYGARNLRIFGSVARGDAGPDSDVDILVDFESGRSLLDLVGLEQDLRELLGCRVDVISEGGVNPNVEDCIRKDAVPL